MKILIVGHGKFCLTRSCDNVPDSASSAELSKAYLAGCTFYTIINAKLIKITTFL